MTPAHPVWQVVATLLATLGHQSHTQATVALSYTLTTTLNPSVTPALNPTTTAKSTNIIEALTTQETITDCQGSLAMRPSGDIWGQVGSVNKVICYVNDRTTSLTATNLTFTSNMTLLSHQVVDEYTISVNLKESAATHFRLSCMDTSRDNNCIGMVYIGYPPMDVENLECVSYNWMALKCTWTLPYNPVQTHNYRPYLLSTLNGEGSECDSGGVTDSCDDLKTCCLWRPPEYPAAESTLQVLFQVSNTLSNQTFNFNHTIRNYAVVLPDAAKSVEVAPVVGSLELEVTWSLPSPMDYFSSIVGVVYSVDYRLGSDPQHHHPWVTGATGQCSSANSARVEAEYWWQEYEVRVRLRSAAANFTLDDDAWWSDWSAVTADTPPAEPKEAPAVGPGTFKVSRNTPECRDLTLSWRPLPTLLHNGPEFFYFVTATLDPGGESVGSVTVTEPFATFTNLSTSLPYRLEVVSQNSEGRSQVGSWVVVGADNDLPDSPVLPVVILHQQQQQYELRWRSSESGNTTTYTVYVCTDGLNTEQPCKADLYWLTVGEVTTINVTLEEFNLTEVGGTGVRFAVSAERAASVSSGMSWDTCSTPRLYTTAHRPPTLTSPIDVSETTARVQWTLDCDDRAGVVEAVEVTYCLGQHNLTHDCQGESARESEVWSCVVEVRQLAAASQYTVWLRIWYRSGVSQWSTPQHFTTELRRGLAAWVIGVITIGAILSAVVLVFFCSYSRRKLQNIAIELKREPNLPNGLVNGDPKRLSRRYGDPGILTDSGRLSASGHVPKKVHHSNFQPATQLPRSFFFLDSEGQNVPSGRGLALGGHLQQPSGEKEENLSDQVTRTTASRSTTPGRDGETISSCLTESNLSPAVASPEGSSKTDSVGNMSNGISITGASTPGYVTVQQERSTNQENMAFVPQGIKYTVNLDKTDNSDSNMREVQSSWAQNVNPATGYVVVSPPDWDTHNAEGLLNATGAVDSHDTQDHKASKFLETSSVLPECESIMGRYLTLEFPEEDNDHLNLPMGARTPLIPLQLNNKYDTGAKVLEKCSNYLELLSNDDSNVQTSRYIGSEKLNSSGDQIRQHLKVGVPQGYVVIQEPNSGISNQGSNEVSVHKGEVTLGDRKHDVNVAKIMTTSISKPSEVSSASFTELGSKKFSSSPQLVNTSQAMAMMVMNKSHELLVKKDTTSTPGYIPHPLAEEAAGWDPIASTGPLPHTTESFGLNDLVIFESYPDKEIDSTALVTGRSDQEGQGTSMCVNQTPEDLPLGYSRVGSPT